MFRQAALIFRNFAESSRKRLFCAGAPLFAAAAVALSDKELKKQPLWYQTAVRKLAFAVKYTNKKGYIDDVVLLENLRQKLLPYSDTSEAEILWRYGRVLLEIALWTSSADKNRMKTFQEAELICKKAVECENPAEPCANAHKWYGITLVKLMDFRSDKKLEEARKHLQRAVELDPHDARSWQFLGIVQYCMKDYKAAAESHKKAEEIQPGFSNENTLWLGKAQLALHDKKAACESFLKAKSLVPQYRNEFKAGLQLKELLLKRCRLKADQMPDGIPPY